MMLGVYDQTKQTDVAPQCGGDVDALTLAVPLSHTVIGGHFRSSPWFRFCPKKKTRVEFGIWYVFYVGIGWRPVTAKTQLKLVTYGQLRVAKG